MVHTLATLPPWSIPWLPPPPHSATTPTKSRLDERPLQFSRELERHRPLEGIQQDPAAPEHPQETKEEASARVLRG